MPKIVLVQCTNQKRDGTHAARDLYDESTYFRKQRAYAEAAECCWFIQSAKYGLVEPERRIAAYDEHAKDIDDPSAWAEVIAEQLERRTDPPAVVEVLGGAAYADPLTPELEAKGYDVIEPLRGLGIGERMARLDDMQRGVENATLYG